MITNKTHSQIESAAGSSHEKTQQSIESELERLRAQLEMVLTENADLHRQMERRDFYAQVLAGDLREIDAKIEMLQIERDELQDTLNGIYGLVVETNARSEQIHAMQKTQFLEAVAIFNEAARTQNRPLLVPSEQINQLINRLVIGINADYYDMMNLTPRENQNPFTMLKRAWMTIEHRNRLSFVYAFYADLVHTLIDYERDGRWIAQEIIARIKARNPIPITYISAILPELQKRTARTPGKDIKLLDYMEKYREWTATSHKKSYQTQAEIARKLAISERTWRDILSCYNALEELAKEWKKVETFFYPEHETDLETWFRQKIAEKLPDFDEKSW